MKAPIADATIWTLNGKTWCVHARHPHTGAWIRVTGISHYSVAVVEADALCLQLDREAERIAA